ncbi:MAG TPA: hypothetical protein VGG85_04390 [Terracidiphilus sp.]|jgi:hypothetical protein
MSSVVGLSRVRRFVFLGAAALLAVGTASAQSASISNSLNEPGSANEVAVSSTTFSSSNDGMSVLDSGSSDAAEPSAAEPSPAGGGGRQYDNRSGGGSGGRFGHLAFEAGGGFNAPIGNDTPYITWGGNFTVGGGLHLSRRFSVLGEFQFMDNKLPGALVAAGGGTGGNAHIIGLTVDPVIDLFPKRANSVYVTGGGGYYHKSTNFTVQECCDFYGYPVNVTANSFSSNQGGLNLGIGYTHRLGGVYGDGTAKLFAEARYTWIDTPPITDSNGLGRTELIPVTFGIRW